MSGFIPVAEFAVRGLRNRYRQPGVGAPLAAALSPGEGPAVDMAQHTFRRASRCQSPLSPVSRMRGHCHGPVRGLELYPADEATSVEVADERVPLELEPTATLAYMLEGAPVWDTESPVSCRRRRPAFARGS